MGAFAGKGKRKGKGGQYRRRGREEGQIVLRVFEKALQKHTILYLPKIAKYIHIHTYKHVYIIHTHIYVYIYKHTYMQIYVYICKYI